MDSDADPSAPRPRAPIVLTRTCPRCAARFPAEREFCPECNAEYLGARGFNPRLPHQDPFAPERTALGWGVWGGLLLLVVAVVSFVVGWRAGYVFWYPPILAAVGLGGIWQGLTARKRKVPPRRRRRGSSNP